MVREARKDGLPATIYRVGNLVGHSRTGIFQRNIGSDAYHRILKAFILLEAASEDHTYLDVTPIDYCSSSLVYLLFRPDTAGRTFHLCNPNPVTVSEIVSQLHHLGYPITVLPPRQFNKFLFHDTHPSERHLEGASLIITELDGEQIDENTSKITCIDCTETVQWLRDSGIECPKADQKLMNILIQHMIEVGFIPKPDKWEWLNHAEEAADEPYQLLPSP